jgi:arylsulfatase A-like enzyme
MKTLLLGIDTLRADHMSCYGYPRPTCPHVDALAAEGTVFVNNSSAYSFTLPSFTSMITGKHPLNHGIVMNPHSHPNVNAMMLDDSLPTLAELFWDSAHVTCAVDNLFSFLSHPKWFIRGYEYHINPTGTSLPRHGRVRADDVNRLLFPWLRQHAGDDFFLFVHYWDPHGPYEAPDRRFRDLYSPRKLQDLPVVTAPSGEPYVMGAGPLAALGDEERLKVGRYDGEISYLDDRLGQLFDLLQALGIYDQMTIMLASDHGDIMVEREQHFSHRGIWHPTMHTPMILKLPKGLAADPLPRSEALVSNVDILPTLIDIAGIPVAHRLDGHSLLPLVRREATQVRPALYAEGTYPHHGIPQRSLRVGSMKVIKYEPEFVPPQGAPDGVQMYGRPWWPASEVELYDLVADPAETRNLADERPDQAAAMVQQLDEWVAAHRDEPERPDSFAVLMPHWHLGGAIF